MAANQEDKLLFLLDLEFVHAIEQPRVMLFCRLIYYTHFIPVDVSCFKWLSMSTILKRKEKSLN